MFLYNYYFLRRGVNYMTRPSQRESIALFIERQYEINGYPPSLSEIAEHLGLTSKSNIYRQLQQLVAEGRLVNNHGRYVPTSVYEKQPFDVVMVPVLGMVAAGRPIFAEENLDGYVAYLPRFGDGNDLFALKIKGESMIEAGIFDGDIVVVQKTPVSKNGDIVVAMLEDEATVKTIYRENGHIRLQPQNHEFQPIIVPDAVILGRVVASIKYH
jgi:repressor LexA